MMTGRGFVRLNRFAHAGEWKKRGPELTTKLGGRTVGILGLGRIGKAIAQRVRAMGMKVAYTGRKPQDVAYRFVPDLKALAAESDFLVVACPGGAATKNIVNADVLAALGKKGTIVNIARGSIIDEPALVAALQAGTIKGAGLDVFADEPQHSRAALLTMDNVVLLPHVGSATRETRRRWATCARRISTRGSPRKPLPTLDPRARVALVEARPRLRVAWTRDATIGHAARNAAWSAFICGCEQRERARHVRRLRPRRHRANVEPSNSRLPE